MPLWKPHLRSLEKSNTEGRRVKPGAGNGTTIKQRRSGQEAVHPSARSHQRFPSFRFAVLLIVVITASLILTTCGNSEFYLQLQRLVEQYEAEQEGKWVEIKKLLASDGSADDIFGNSVAIDKDYALVGARYDDNDGSDSGSAYIFQRTGTNTWDAEFKITASDGTAGHKFGYSVAISGDYVIVGAMNDDDNGTAYVFTIMP